MAIQLLQQFLDDEFKREAEISIAHGKVVGVTIGKIATNFSICGQASTALDDLR